MDGRGAGGRGGEHAAHRGETEMQRASHKTRRIVGRLVCRDVSRLGARFHPGLRPQASRFHAYMLRTAASQEPYAHTRRASRTPQVFRFVSSKNASLFLQRKNPRKIAWTTVYRRMHKKGITEEVAKKRSRRTVKHQRGVVGASLEAIAARRNQKPEVRAAAQASALAKSKEDKKKKAEERKANKAKVS